MLVSSSFLGDKNFGLGLKDFESEHKILQATNALVFSRSNAPIGDIMAAFNYYWQNIETTT